MAVTNFYWLDRIDASQQKLVGEKAFRLGQLMQQGYQCIPGIVVSAALLREVLETLEESEPLFADAPESWLHLDVDNYQVLQGIAQQLRRELSAVALPREWLDPLLEAAQTWQASTLILRPSLTSPQPIPKLLRSRTCRAEPDAIANALKQVWAELFSARSLFYWQRQGIGLDRLGLAVLVQPLAAAIASGSAETTPECCSIRATWGLGYSLVRGEVWPDLYEVDPRSGTVQACQVGNKPRAYSIDASDPVGVQAYLLDEAQQQQAVLDQQALQQLVALVQKLSAEQASGFQLEWVLAQLWDDFSAQVYLTQCDPALGDSQAITSQPSEPTDRPQQIVFKGISASPGYAIAPAHVLSGMSQHLQAIPPGSILVTKSLAPDWLPLLKQAAGVIAEQGGMTSHAAILARELGIPAVVGVANATTTIQTRETIALDGNQGEVFRYPDSLPNEASPQQSQPPLQPPTFTPPPLATQLWVNLSQPQLAKAVAALPVDGVGLLRSELMMLEWLSAQPLSQWLQPQNQPVFVQHLVQAIAQIADAFAPRPVFYRSTDLRLDPLANSQDTSDRLPLLVNRGSYSYQLDSTLFDLELEALAQAQQSGCRNLKLILPFVRSVEEFRFCQRRVQAFNFSNTADFQLWIMAEVPSILFLLPQYIAAGVEGIAIGTNDLSQLLLGFDREHPLPPGLSPARHPALLAALRQLVEQAQTANLPCSVCGQLPASSPELIDDLVRWGVDAISVPPDAIESTYQAIARSEKRLLLAAARHFQGN